MDVNQTIEGLRLERDVASERLRRIDVAIAALEQLDGTASARPMPLPSANGEEWAEYRRLYEAGERTVVQIASAMRVSTATVYNRKHREKWGKPAKVVTDVE